MNWNVPSPRLRDRRLLWLPAVLSLAAHSVDAKSLETQSNPLVAGTVAVVPGDPQREGWNTVPTYRLDVADDASPNNYTSVQVANDDDQLYLHFLFSEAQPLNFRHNYYLDTDQSRRTGYYGTGSGHLPIGAEYLIQGPNLFRFTAAQQNGWAWEFVESLTVSGTPTTDVEARVSLEAFGNPEAFDFTMYAGNFDLGLKEDYYPSNSNLPGGGFFTYVIGRPVGIDELTLAIKEGSDDARFDLNGDSNVDQLDRTYWVQELRGTDFGDANLDGTIDSGDLIQVFQAGEYEDALVANSTWATGDWTGDCEFDSSDLVLALSTGRFGPDEPAAAVASVPEPSSMCLALFGLLAGLRRFRR